MTTRSVDNYNTVENYSDVVDILISENAVNNVPNSSNTIGGEIPVWNGSTYSLQGNTSIGICLGAGIFQQSGNSVAIGHSSGRHNQGTGCIALGLNSARTHQGSGSIAIGLNCASNTQGTNSIAIGNVAGEINQGPNCIAIGWRAGQFSQGTNSIAIGFNTGLTSQPENSIVINSSAAILNGITASFCYISPIRNVITGGSTNNFLCYDDTNKEIVQASNIQYANPVSFPLGTATQTSVNFGTPGTGIFSSGTNNINFSTAGTTRLDIQQTRLSISLPITLPTTGGSPSNLDYYEETTFSSTWTYGNATIASIKMSINRIGKQKTLYVPISVTQTNTNGSSATVTINTSFPSRFRPNAQITLPFYLNNAATIGLHSITIFTDGNITIAQNSGAGFTNNTSVVFVANSLSWIN